MLRAWNRNRPKAMVLQASGHKHHFVILPRIWKGYLTLETHLSSFLTLLSDLIDVSVLFDISHDSYTFQMELFRRSVLPSVADLASQKE